MPEASYADVNYVDKVSCKEVNCPMKNSKRGGAPPMNHIGNLLSLIHICKYSFDENGQHNEDNGSENMIIRGDNLEALKACLLYTSRCV